MATIFIADDEKNVTDLLAEYFRNEGHNVVVAYDGKEAVEKLGVVGSLTGTPLPDIIILDIRMPQVDGYTIFTLLQQNEASRSIPMIVLTSRRNMEDLFESAHARISYMRKPFDLQVLRRQVQDILATPLSG